LQVEQFAGFQPKANACEQAAITAYAFQIVSFKHGKKPKEISGEL
jgi:hypothetical protein